MNKDRDLRPSDSTQSESMADENIGIMVYGNLRIVDKDTGEVLVNKRA